MADERFGVPTDEQLAKINRLTKRPFAKDEVFTYPVKQVGNAQIPNRLIKLDKSLLEVYAKNGNNGDVAYMLNHRWSAWFGLSEKKGVINLGRVYDAWVAESSDFGDETHALFGEVYIPRDRVKDGVSTNEVIESVEDGSLRDVSVGIGWSRSECSVCGLDVRDKNRDDGCKHYPGRTYDGKLCYVIAKPPGDQFELSGVFAGAYPTAEALSETPTDKDAKSEGAVQAFAVEDIVNLPMDAQVFAAFSDGNVTLFARKDALAKRGSFSIAPAPEATTKGGEEVEGEKSKWDSFGEEAEKHGLTAEQANEVFAKVVELSNTHGVSITELAGKLEGAVFAEVIELDAAGSVVLDASRVVDVLGKEMGGDELLKLAKDGQMLKAEKMEDVLTWGVRADGNAFARDTYVELLANASVETLNKMRDQFKTKAKETLAPGRVTQPTETASKKRDVPDSAFKA